MLRVERDADGVGRIVLDRPDAKQRARPSRCATASSTRCATSAPIPSVRAVLITGDGDAFCAGMDLSASTVAQAGKPGFSTRSTSEALRAGVQTFIRELWELDKPTVAAVNGAAVGPGAHLALACDFVFVRARAPGSCGRSPSGASSSTPAARTCCPASSASPRAKAMVMLGEGVNRRRGRRPRPRVPVRRHRRRPAPAAMPKRSRPGSQPARRGRSACRSGCSTRRSRPTSPTRSSSKATSKRSRPPRPTSSKGMAAFRDKRDAELRRPNVSDRRAVQRVARRTSCASTTHDRLLLCRLTDITEPTGLVDACPAAASSSASTRKPRAFRELDEETGLQGRLGRAARVDSMTGAGRASTKARRSTCTASGSCTAPRSTGGELRHETDGSSDRGAVVHAATSSTRSTSSTWARSALELAWS